MTQAISFKFIMNKSLNHNGIYDQNNIIAN